MDHDEPPFEMLLAAAEQEDDALSQIDIELEATIDEHCPEQGSFWTWMWRRAGRDKQDYLEYPATDAFGERECDCSSCQGMLASMAPKERQNREEALRMAALMRKVSELGMRQYREKVMVWDKLRIVRARAVVVEALGKANDARAKEWCEAV